MTYVVTDKCIKCKFTDCVEVCPVDAFREGANTLIIDPSICIDCALCEPECPIEAIVSENSSDPMLPEYIQFAEDMSDSWPIIVEAIDPMDGADDHKDRVGKWGERSTEAGKTDP
jgi:ferredoxin